MDVCHTFFIHTCAHGYLGCPHSLTDVNSAVLNTDIQVVLQKAHLAYLGQRQVTDAITGSYGSCIFSF